MFDQLVPPASKLIGVHASAQIRLSYIIYNIQLIKQHVKRRHLLSPLSLLIAVSSLSDPRHASIDGTYKKKFSRHIYYQDHA